MNQSLSTFLKIAVTAVAISAFLFVIGYNMINSETGQYKTKIEAMDNQLQSGTATTPTTPTTP